MFTPTSVVSSDTAGCSCPSPLGLVALSRFASSCTYTCHIGYIWHLQPATPPPSTTPELTQTQLLRPDHASCISHVRRGLQVQPGHLGTDTRTTSEYTSATSFSSGTLRHAYTDSTDHSRLLSTSSTTSTRLGISFHPDDRCTLTLTGGTPQANPVAAHATSLSYLQSQPKFSISQKCNFGLTSVSVKFPTDMLQLLPLLQNAFRSRPPSHGDETLTSHIELGAGINVWALLDLLACIAAAWNRGAAAMPERVRGMLQKSLEGQNLSALADLRQVSPSSLHEVIAPCMWPSLCSLSCCGPRTAHALPPVFKCIPAAPSCVVAVLRFGHRMRLWRFQAAGAQCHPPSLAHALTWSCMHAGGRLHDVRRCVQSGAGDGRAGPALRRRAAACPARRV